MPCLFTFSEWMNTVYDGAELQKKKTKGQLTLPLPQSQGTETLNHKVVVVDIT